MEVRAALPAEADHEADAHVALPSDSRRGHVLALSLEFPFYSVTHMLTRVRVDVPSSLS